VQRSLKDTLWERATSYGGDLVHVTPPEGETPTTTVTDARGRTEELHQYHGSTPEGPADVTSYAYTPADQVKMITGPDGSNWRYAYDLFGRQTKAVDPDSGETLTTYDHAGQVLTRTEGRGVTLAYEYDDLGRKTRAYEDSADGELLAEWTYDTLPGGGSAGVGMPTSSTRHHEGHPYTVAVTDVDDGGRPTTSAVTVPEALVGVALAGTYETRYRYYPDGSLDTTRLPGMGQLPRETVSVEYNDQGLPRKTLGWNTIVDETHYTPYGEVQRLDLGAESGLLSQKRQRESSTRRLERNQVIQTQGTVEVDIEDNHYDHDLAGNILKITNVPSDANPDTQCFDYDHLRRLTEVWTPSAGECAAEPSSPSIQSSAPYWTSYEYDEGGNRTLETQHATSPTGSDTVRTYDYPDMSDGQPHTLTSVEVDGPAVSGAVTYTYDDSGRTESRTIDGVEQTFEWDVEGRIASVTSGNGTTRFVYDADGTRLVRQEPDSTTLYLGGHELRLDHDTDELVGTRYYGHASESVAVRTSQGVTFLTGDHHGTATMAVNSQSGDITRRQFDPFGNSRGSEPVSWVGERGFINGTNDTSTGLVHLGAREYDPAVGRFISVDPVLNADDPQQMNGYSYAENNPVNRADPSGLLSCGGKVDGAGCRGVKDGAAGGPSYGGSSSPWYRGYTPHYPHHRPARQFQICPDGAEICPGSKPATVEQACGKVVPGPSRGGYSSCEIAQQSRLKDWSLKALAWGITTGVSSAPLILIYEAEEIVPIVDELKRISASDSSLVRRFAAERLRELTGASGTEFDIKNSPYFSDNLKYRENKVQKHVYRVLESTYRSKWAVRGARILPPIGIAARTGQLTSTGKNSFGTALWRASVEETLGFTAAASVGAATLNPWYALAAGAAVSTGAENVSNPPWAW
jgi:RHS repeat-associated protein